MKQHSLLTLSLLLSSIALHATTKQVSPKYTIRSQGANAARRIVNSTQHIKLYGEENWYGTFSLTPEYSRSFDGKEIAKCLFGSDCLKIQGSRVSGRDENAFLADYFYLPTDFSSVVSLQPRIQNFLVDMYLFVGLDEFVEGLYFWLQAPVTWTKWDLDFDEKVAAAGVNAHAEGYFTPNELTRTELLSDFTSFMQGNSPGAGASAIVQTINAGQENEFKIATKFDGLDCAKVCRSKAKTQISEVRAALGYNFLLEEDYHLGLELQVVAPTGNDPRADFLFAPQNGNDNHWELGGALSTHYTFWRSDDEESSWGFYLDVNLTHMFNNHQTRCFDLCGKPLSRYMLAEKLTDNVQNNLQGDGVDADYQFAGEYAPVANITKTDVDVRVSIQADLVAMFNYTCGGWSWDLGYNFWARSCEKIRLNCDCSAFPENTWALKGDAAVYGYVGGTDGDVGNPVALSATMNNATINGGDNFGTTASIPVADGIQNSNIDNAQLATSGATALNVNREMGANQTHTSIQPVFITQDNINFARTKGISNKLFSHAGYTWINKNDWVPYLGVGFEVEWGTTGNNCDDCDDCDNSCDECGVDCNEANGNCLKCALTQWGIWTKVGVSF